jgi:hypothetical protein
MFQEEVSSSQSYFHAKPRVYVTNLRDWKRELAVNEHDRGLVLKDKRYLNPRIGTKYFAESKATARAELGARAEQGQGRPLRSFKRFLAFEVVFKPETEVFSMVKARHASAKLRAEYGVTFAACQDADRYEASIRLAEQVTPQYAGVKYPSVRRREGHCLAMCFPERDIHACIDTGDL